MREIISTIIASFAMLVIELGIPLFFKEKTQKIIVGVIAGIIIILVWLWVVIPDSLDHDLVVEVSPTPTFASTPTASPLPEPIQFTDPPELDWSNLSTTPRD